MIRIKIDNSGEAFNHPYEAGRVLRIVAGKLDDLYSADDIKDITGKVVGCFEVD